MQKLILFLLLTSFDLSAQEMRSIHQRGHDYHSKSVFNSDLYKTPVTLKKNNSTNIVFGFFPSWEYSSGTYQRIRYDLLTHIAISSFSADEDGNLTEPQGKPWTELIDSVHAHNIKLIMTVSNFTSEQIHKLLTEQTSKLNLFDKILEKITIYGFDGVNIDFENLAGGDEGHVINDFMKSLTDSIKSKKPLLEISFDSQVVKSGDWDFKGLADACDYLFVMGYDFYGSWSETTGPSSPLIGDNFSLTKSFENDYIDVPPGKLILGVPYYGNYWKTNSKEPYADVAQYDSTKPNNNWVKPALRYNEIVPYYTSNEKMWDSVSQTPWLRWGQDTSWNQIWYDDENSLALKYDLAISKNLKGIGIWALGYDDGRSELWNLIERKFINTSSVVENDSGIPSSFELYQNYPNPFNPETIISYQLSVAGHVSLKVFDLLGREVATLVDEDQTAGIYNSRFSSTSGGKALHSTLASGVYIYSLKANGFVESKKMVLLR